MHRTLHLLGRKLKTVRTTIAACKNWPSILLHKFGAPVSVETLELRDGLRIRPIPPLKKTWGEIFEPAIADIYDIRKCDPDFIIDVGANIGAFACLAAKTHPRATVHAFEPSQPHADRLAENAALNGLNNIVLHRQAVTKDGRDAVFTVLEGGGSSGFFLHEAGSSSLIGSVSPDCLDFSKSRFLFLKLDCEGAEGEIIEWICTNREKLPSCVRIACEYHHWCPVPSDVILQNLRTCGFVAQERILFDECYLFASLGNTVDEAFL
jgi:FkbM family methyltransferase